MSSLIKFSMAAVAVVVYLALVVQVGQALSTVNASVKAIVAQGGVQ